MTHSGERRTWQSYAGIGQRMVLDHLIMQSTSVPTANKGIKQNTKGRSGAYVFSYCSAGGLETLIIASLSTFQSFLK